MLLPRDQTLFMDLWCFSCLDGYPSYLDIEWLCDAFQQDEEELTYQLEHLKQKGLLQDVDLRSRRFSMHDLYLEFAKLEANGSFKDPTNLKKRMWVYVDNGDLTKLESKPKGGLWHKLIRLAITQSSLAFEKQEGIVGGVGGMRGMKWDYFCNVEVLQLSRLQWGHGALNLEALMCLRILELDDVSGIDRVEGLEKLNHLTYFNWECGSSDTISAHIIGQLPLSLKRLHIIEEDVVLESDVLAQCQNLSDLTLFEVKAHTLDLSNCRSLHCVRLADIRNLQSLLGLSISQPSNLQSLFIHCEDLVDIPGIHYLIGLKALQIFVDPKFRLPDLLALTKLQVLWISSEQDGLLVHAKDYIPHQLQELCWCLSQSKEGPNLRGFNHLEVLDLSCNKELTSLAKLGDLPALRRLHLQFCEHLLQLPNLGMSSNLEVLDLDGCLALELYEKDIQMLSKLPLLQPMSFSRKGEDKKFRLDTA